MFYCEACRRREGLPKDLGMFQAVCEFCGENKRCHATNPEEE